MKAVHLCTAKSFHDAFTAVLSGGASMKAVHLCTAKRSYRGPPTTNRHRLNEGRASLHGEGGGDWLGLRAWAASMKAVHLCTAKQIHNHISVPVPVAKPQ